MIVFWNAYTAYRTGSATREVHCEKCGARYHYLLCRDTLGQGTSLFFLDNRGAEERAGRRADEKLARVLARAVDPVPCPACNHFQADMVVEARRRRFAWMSLRYVPIGIIAWVCLSFFAIIANAAFTNEPVIPWRFFYPIDAALGCLIVALPLIRTLLAIGYDPNRESRDRQLLNGYCGGTLLEDEREPVPTPIDYVAKVLASIPEYMTCEECGQQFKQRAGAESPLGFGVCPCPSCGRIQAFMLPAARAARSPLLLTLGILFLAVGAVLLPAIATVNADRTISAEVLQSRILNMWIAFGCAVFAGGICILWDWRRAKTNDPNRRSLQARLRVAEEIAVKREV